ncbi:hypothetical protein HRbin20_01244 [bacterium HR20]|jgi:hypothetical protein|nr:hypothetical protein HRbin20_01244 [bacterium HR20]GIV55746.1 MAG: hypothetical protein KatS3mg040_0514 [Candidatus Kapabacteria bacterium]
MLTMLDNLFWDARALRLATQPGERVPLCCFAAEKLTHTHTPFHAGCCSMKSAHRHVEHEIACVGMEENNALFMFHYL